PLLSSSLSTRTRPPPCSTLFPYTTLFRSRVRRLVPLGRHRRDGPEVRVQRDRDAAAEPRAAVLHGTRERPRLGELVKDGRAWFGDRKSTRLNSSHVAISYAVFCLKKKKTN